MRTWMGAMALLWAASAGAQAPDPGTTPDAAAQVPAAAEPTPAVPEAPAAPAAPASEPAVTPRPVPPPINLPIEDEPASTDSDWEVGVGLMGMVGGSFLSDLSTEDEITEVNGRPDAILYPGFGGVGGGGGLALNASWRGFIGLEVDVLYTLDQGKGDISGLDIEMKQWALHLPVLVKASLPAGLVRPSIFVGPDFVFPGKTEYEVSELIVRPTITADAEPYVQLAAGIGFEFLLPIPKVDLRVPLTLRGAWNPGAGDKIDDRADISCEGSNCEVKLKAEWEYQVGATLGVAYYFL